MVKNPLIRKPRARRSADRAACGRIVELEFILSKARRIMVNARFLFAPASSARECLSRPETRR